jgi:putative CocE/NonD family hydrolase
MGAEAWRDLPAWPPPARLQSLYLAANACLAGQPSAADAPDDYIYDPADPTPSFGGPLMSPHAGRRDNLRLEARPDVLVFTSEALEVDLTVMGTAAITLYVRSSLDNTDFFVRLCDVQRDGCSLNITDGFLRLSPGVGAIQDQGILRLEISLWPTAYQFKAGHRLRLQVSSGAHPRISRNTGEALPLAQASRLLPAHQTVFHDTERPSAIIIPVV